MDSENINQSIKNQEDQKSTDPAYSIFRVYLEIEKSFINDLQTKRIAEIKDYKETIRNLILTNGAIAAFGLPLLDNPKIFKGPLILSSILLLVNIIISYWHLQKGWTKNFKAFISLEERVIGPIKNMKELAIETMRGNESIEKLITKDKEFKENNGGYDKIITELSNILPDTKKLNNIDTVIITLFTLAILLLIYAIAGNYMNDFFIYIIKTFK